MMNDYFRDYNLYPSETAADLAARLNKTPFLRPFRHYGLVTDGRGLLLGGLAVTETYRVRTTLITRMSAILRALNRLFRVVPLDGQLRPATVGRSWFEVGQEEAMRHLLEMVRWEWREEAATIIPASDVRGPMMRVANARPWTAVVVASLAVRAPTSTADRLFYYAWATQGRRDAVMEGPCAAG
jgi:hypothetical protein